MSTFLVTNHHVAEGDSRIGTIMDRPKYSVGWPRPTRSHDYRLPLSADPMFRRFKGDSKVSAIKDERKAPKPKDNRRKK